MTPGSQLPIEHLASDGTVLPAHITSSRGAVDAAAKPSRPPRVPKTPPPVIVKSPSIVELSEAIRAAASPTAREQLTTAFWEEMTGRGTPLVEAPWPAAPGERAVTFLWRDRHGTRPGTRTVVLLLNKVTDPSVWDQSVLHRIDGTDIWHRTYRLPSTWQGTYQLAADDGPTAAAEAGGAAHGPRSRWAGVASGAVSDPLCPVQMPGKPGELPSSVAILDAAPPQPWRKRRPLVRRGTLTDGLVESGLLAEPRRVWVYTPHPRLAASSAIDGAATNGAPRDLLVVLDGEDWAGRLDLVSTLDNLHADGRIRPTAAVLVDAIDTPSRWRDLACNDRFTGFLTGELLDRAAVELDLDLSDARVILSGRSLGGLTALYAGVRAPERFHAVIAQSTSLWWPSEPAGDRAPGWLQDQLASAERLPAAITLEVGSEEWILREPARQLAARLAARGDVDLHLNEYDGGHDAWCWRGSLADELARLGSTPREAGADAGAGREGEG